MQRLFSIPSPPKRVTAIEGTPTVGTFFVTPMLGGDHISMVKVRMAQGVRSQFHKHSHESLIYVISGSLKTVIADEVLIIHHGESCRHPQHILHSVEALADTLFIEVKAPVPDLKTTLGISNASHG